MDEKTVIPFGGVLRQCREDRGYSKRKLAQLAGYSTTYITLLENDEHEPTLSALLRLARALMVDPCDLVRSVNQALPDDWYKPSPEQLEKRKPGRPSKKGISS